MRSGNQQILHPHRCLWFPQAGYLLAFSVNPSRVISIAFTHRCGIAIDLRAAFIRSLSRYKLSRSKRFCKAWFYHTQRKPMVAHRSSPGYSKMNFA